MEYLFYSALFIALYVYLGFGFSFLLCRRQLARNVVVFSPWVGYCYASLLGWVCFKLDLAGTNRYGYFLLIPPFCSLAYAVYSISRGRFRLPSLKSWGWIGASIVACAAFIFLSLPFLLAEGELTARSLGNIDVAVYASYARYLQEFRQSESLPVFDRLAEHNLDLFRFGSFFVTSLPGSLFSVEVHKLQNNSCNSFFLFTLLLIFEMARQVFLYRIGSALAVTSVVGLSPILYYTVYHGFASQIIAMGLTCALMIVGVHVVRRCATFKQCAGHLPLTALLLWGILATYAHMLPIVVVVVSFCSLSLILAKHDRLKSAARVVAFTVVAVMFAFAITPERAISLPRLFAWTAGAGDAGWPVSFLSLDRILGFIFFTTDLEPQALGTTVLSTSIVGLLLLAGWYRTFAVSRSLGLFAFVSVAIIAAGVVAVFVLAESDTMGAGYRAYKLTSFFLPQVVLGSLMLFRSLHARYGTLGKAALVSGFLLVIGVNGFSTHYLVRKMMTSHREAGKDLVNLSSVESRPEIESINIPGTDWWETMWKAHFLLRKPISIEKETYYPATPLTGEWDLKNSEFTKAFILSADDLERPETIRINESYYLERARNNRILEVSLGKGWYPPERTHCWTGSNGDEAKVLVRSNAGPLEVEIVTTYAPLDPANKISFSMNGKPLSECPSAGTCRLRSVLDSGDNFLEIKSSLPPTQPNNGDPRLLGYSFKEIRVNAVQ